MIKQKSITHVLDYRSGVVQLIGLATFFFGFFAGALYNIYLILTHSPILVQFRTSLTYQSAIFGDGILLPVVNMIVASFLLKYFYQVSKKLVFTALGIGGLITLYFHVTQALEGLVNWAMPTPWHWNFLGAWHAAYMFSVASFLSLFYLVWIKFAMEKEYKKEIIIVTLGIVLFFILLRLDYITVSFSQLLLR